MRPEKGKSGKFYVYEMPNWDSPFPNSHTDCIKMWADDVENNRTANRGDCLTTYYCLRLALSVSSALWYRAVWDFVVDIFSMTLHFGPF